ncbi:hypothetical protein SAMN02745248_00591 [Hathewaya proteolytica DSM 3090]|uniref:Uncharacterized protein n=1 Tax=Hathewaya proteolytica DSM 3090 TaxID=1121331 RepID=A0A1M6L213_9CLOT|nr:hypothetical protein [Hathewaya proteolytica]SHJ65174.1 hypothetical protein SAMN02745248_00591 [Hathewaya proteolytica DSM 3090]
MINIKKIQSKKTVLTKPQKNLILQSSICDRDKELKSVLNLFKGSISVCDLESIKTKYKDQYDLLSSADAVNEMIEVSSKEWRSKEYKETTNQPCELCGNPHSKEKFIILNLFNHNEMLVGSSCIKKFPHLDNNLYNITTDEYAKLIKSHQIDKIERIINFDKRFNCGNITFKEWKNKYDSYEISLPTDYDKDFINILRKSKSIYTSYVSRKISELDLNKFTGCLKEYEWFVKKCEKFVHENSTDKYICTKSIENFLINTPERKGILNMIKETAKIRKDMAKYVCKKEFIKRFEDRIMDIFSKYNLVLKQITDEIIQFEYKYKTFDTLLLQCSLKEFTMKFSNIFYDMNVLNKGDIFDTLFITINRSNINRFIEILNHILKNTKYYFYIDYDMYEREEIELRTSNTKKFTTIDMDIIYTFNKVLYLEMNESKQILMDYINSVKVWSNTKDKDKYDIGAIDKVWSTDSY